MENMILQFQWLRVSKMMNNCLCHQNDNMQFLKMKINKNVTKIISPDKFLLICKIHKILEIECIDEILLMNKFIYW